MRKSKQKVMSYSPLKSTLVTVRLRATIQTHYETDPSSLLWSSFRSLALGETADEPQAPADLIIHNARSLLSMRSSRSSRRWPSRTAVFLPSVRTSLILKHKGPKTRLLDADGHTVLPGLYDSHVHPVGAALSELRESLPVLKSLKDVFAHIRKQAARTPEGEWIVVRFAFPHTAR